MENAKNFALENQSAVTKTAEEPIMAPLAEPENHTADVINRNDVPGSLPKGYLESGYHATTDKGAKYLRPEFVGKYAQTIAALLADMKRTDFNSLLREMKRSRKRFLPFEACLTAAAELLPKSMALVSRKKAPGFLIDFIKDNLDHSHDDDDWTAFYRHLEAIAGYMATQEGGDS